VVLDPDHIEAELVGARRQRAQEVEIVGVRTGKRPNSSCLP
jgi:hypothetical protein